MSGPPIYPQQEQAMDTLRGLGEACEKISAGYHSWFWPISREQAMSQIRVRVNEISYLIGTPENRVPEGCWDVILAEQAVLRAYISILNPGVEKTALQNLLDILVQPLARNLPAWTHFVQSINNLNTPNRAFPFVEGLQTPAEALKAKAEVKAEVKPEKPGFFASFLMLLDKIRGWFKKKPASEFCDTVIHAAPVTPAIEPRLATHYNTAHRRPPREPGQPCDQNAARYLFKRKF